MLALACSLVAVVGQGLVDFTFRNPVLLMLTWLLVGLLFAATAPRHSHDADVQPRGRPSAEPAVPLRGGTDARLRPSGAPVG